MKLFSKKNSIVIVDIDGTIAKVGDRLNLITGSTKDYDAFYDACDQDEPICDIIKLVIMLAKNNNIVFCTGRRECVREKTKLWIKKHIPQLDKYVLLMRGDGDKRHDTEVKPELLKSANIDLNSIYLVLEDRDSMVSLWRNMGITCLQVADGDF